MPRWHDPPVPHVPKPLPLPPARDAAAARMAPARSGAAAFCARHFSWRGALRLNRHALGWDLLRAPCNVFYAPVWLLLQMLGLLAGRLGAHRASRALNAVPAGLPTRVHSVLRACLRDELLPRATSETERRVTALAMDRYLAARSATAEVTANVVVLAAGLLAFRHLTPGGLGLGRQTSDAIMLEWASREFWAGQALGALWYRWFPPDTPLWLTAACIAMALALIAVAAALSGIVADPLQQAAGLHCRRLRRLCDVLERDLRAAQARGYRPPEPFWARLFDVMDWLRL